MSRTRTRSTSDSIRAPGRRPRVVSEPQSPVSIAISIPQSITPLVEVQSPSEIQESPRSSISIQPRRRYPRVPGPALTPPKPLTPRKSAILAPKASAVLQPLPEEKQTAGMEPEFLTYSPHFGALEVIESAYREQESQRRERYQEDMRKRDAFFKQMKGYIEHARDDRGLQFRRLETHFNQHYEKFVTRSKGVRDAVAMEYEAAETTREQIFTESETQMRSSFDDMLSIMEESSSSLRVVQAHHLEWCYKEVEGIISTMCDVMSRAQESFDSIFSTLVDSLPKRSPPRRMTSPPAYPEIMMPMPHPPFEYTTQPAAQPATLPVPPVVTNVTQQVLRRESRSRIHAGRPPSLTPRDPFVCAFFPSIACALLIIIFIGCSSTFPGTRILVERLAYCATGTCRPNSS